MMRERVEGSVAEEDDGGCDVPLLEVVEESDIVIPERRVWSVSACVGSRRAGFMDVAVRSRGVVCDGASGVGCEVCGDVEDKRSSHARFSSCNLLCLSVTRLTANKGGNRSLPCKFGL